MSETDSGLKTNNNTGSDEWLQQQHICFNVLRVCIWYDMLQTNSTSVFA